MVWTKPIHPEMNVLLEARKAAPPAGESPESKRHTWTVYTRALSRPAPADMKIFDRKIPTAGYDVPVRIYQPAGVANPPCVAYYHGGGFSKGDLDSSDTIAWGYAQALGAVVVSVDYRLTPEHPFPAPFDDSYGVAEWMGRHAGEIGADPTRLGLVGDSAGGNLVAAICLAARDRKGPRIAAQLMIYPVTGEPLTLPSYTENAEAPLLGTPDVIKALDWYLPGGRQADNPYASPARARDHSNMPPTFIHTAEFDPIRDDGRLYAGLLAKAGNWVSYREARGMIHGFLRARVSGEAARKEFEAGCAFMREHL